MSSPTELYLPPTLPYPIKLLALAVAPNAEVVRGTRLLDYSYTHLSPDAPPELRFGTWDASFEGTFSRWSFSTGDIITERHARETPAAFIIEPCKHGVQLGGLCCLCGKDMTSFDYTGFSDASRASIQMTHLANGPTVSLEEAERIERETADHLYRLRKLSLIVDLDQTIVHATVDPTVGEWIGEGEAWEARHAKKVADPATEGKKDSGGGGEEKESEADPAAGTDADDDEVNPNWEALKDVKKFRLGPEALGQPHQRNKKGKEKMIEQEGCMYYIKPRPGLPEFLQAMAAKYEMHVYTMGTRAYAEEVCAAIDPGGKIFGNRILSRDESGSLTQKSLQRLFPCDQSMVVIIDDRADVWEWSPNLVKVIPYDFFVGIGDINSAFLPKLEPMVPPPAPPPPPTTADPSVPEPTAVLPEDDEDEDDEDNSDLEDDFLESDRPSSPVSVSAEDELAAEIEKDEMISRNTLALEAQVEERPLAKMQEELQEREDSKSETGEDQQQPSSEDVTAENGLAPAPAEHEKHVRKALLKNDDTELVRVQRILELVHERFYTAYEAHKPADQRTPKKKKRQDVHVEYDVRNIIPRMRSATLEGVHILFTSVIPLGMRPETHDTWKTATAFGAQCHTELSSRITHVVTNQAGTQKVDAARRYPSIKIVWLNWLHDSIALWQRQDETPYLLEPRPGMGSGAALASPPSDPHQISSDPEPDADDWDEGGALGVEAAEGDFEFGEFSWDKMNDEVEAAMNESDDEGGSPGGGGAGGSGRASRAGSVRGGGASEDEWTDETNSIISSTTSSPRAKRKRVRSVTPSELGALTTNATGSGGEDREDGLRSPLAKRKKLAADRSGASRLKEAFTAEQLRGQSRSRDEDEDSSQRSSPMNGGGGGEDEDEDDSDDSDDEDEDGSSVNMDDDDFLARELEAEWG